MAETAGKKDRKGIGGRKPLWDELDMQSKLDSVKGWAKHGSTDIEMCEMIGISHDTFYKWKNEKPEFAEAIKKGKHVSNGELLNSAFMQSTGFMYIENQAVKVKDYKLFTNEKGQQELLQIERVEVVPVEKYAPPNPTMNIYMLNNRLKDDYKAKVEHEHSGNVEVTLTFEDQLRDLIK